MILWGRLKYKPEEETSGSIPSDMSRFDGGSWEPQIHPREIFKG